MRRMPPNMTVFRNAKFLELIKGIRMTIKLKDNSEIGGDHLSFVGFNENINCWQITLNRFVVAMEDIIDIYYQKPPIKI